MNRVLIRYKVKPDEAENNAELVRDVYRELERMQPGGLRYATLRLDDGVTFVHIAEHGDQGSSPLTELESFRRFQQGIRDRCEELPQVNETHEIGSFRLFAPPLAEDPSGDAT